VVVHCLIQLSRCAPIWAGESVNGRAGTVA
jgi:hypothetical protein